MLLGADGQVQPPSDMLRRLHEIDPHLGLCFGGASRCWWLTWNWRDDDPRRAWIRESKYPAERAFDFLIKLPKDCTADQAYGYVVQCVRRLNGEADRTRLLERVHSYNKKAVEDARAPAVEVAEELIDANFGKVKQKVARSNKDTDTKRLKDFMYDHGVIP